MRNIKFRTGAEPSAGTLPWFSLDWTSKVRAGQDRTRPGPGLQVYGRLPPHIPDIWNYDYRYLGPSKSINCSITEQFNSCWETGRHGLPAFTWDLQKRFGKQLGGWSEQPPPTMEAGGNDCEEETLQTAFKKLRVDAESLSGAESVSDALTPRAPARVGLDGTSGAKAKLSNTKDTWHCCTRKTSRGTSSRSQRRRRSKSPILHPPRFTYCSSAASALAPPGGGLKQQRLAVSDPAADDIPVQAEQRCSAVPGRCSPVLFGVSPSYETRVGGVGLSPEVATAAAPPRWEGGHSGEEKVSPDGASAPLRSDAADFRALSELHCTEGTQSPCGCPLHAAAGSQDGGEREAGSGCSCRQQGPGWNGVEVYSFTGLRSAQQDEARTLSGSSATSPLASGSSAPCAASPLASGSPRSCSEQARAYVDDITIEDLSGYMEYYLYIPKKMSHMAEMMYT